MDSSKSKLRIEEVTSLIIPAPGVTVEQALSDAAPLGHEKIEYNDDGTATLTWYRRVQP